MTKPTLRCLDWLARLVSFDTVSSRSNAPLIYHVADSAASLGLTPRIFPMQDPGKLNLLVTVPSSTGAVDGGILLAGHSDVVPYEGQSWQSSPLELDVRGDKAYGRGTSDMKSFLAGCLAYLPDAVSAPLSVPLHLALTCDEEIGCLGAVRLAESLSELNALPQVCIVGEPTSMNVVVAHKSSNLYRLEVRGVAAHSSLTPNGVNAIEYAADVITFVRRLADEFRDSGTVDDSFDVPFSTASIGVIQGGIAVNTIPETCTVDFEFRTLPATDPSTVIERIRAYVEDAVAPRMKGENEAASIDIHEKAVVPGLASNGDGEAQRLLEKILPTQPRRHVAYATEAGIFQARGIDTVVCGPGDIGQAHTQDEFVTLAQLHEFEQFLETLFDALRVAAPFSTPTAQ